MHTNFMHTHTMHKPISCLNSEFSNIDKLYSYNIVVVVIIIITYQTCSVSDVGPQPISGQSGRGSTLVSGSRQSMRYEQTRSSASCSDRSCPNISNLNNPATGNVASHVTRSVLFWKNTYRSRVASFVCCDLDL